MNLRAELSQCWLWKLGALLKKHSVPILLILWQHILIQWKTRGCGVASHCTMSNALNSRYMYICLRRINNKEHLCVSSFWYSIFSVVTIEGTTSSYVHMCFSIHMPSAFLVASGWVECCEISSIVLGCQGEKGIIRVTTKKECAVDNRGLKWLIFV